MLALRVSRGEGRPGGGPGDWEHHRDRGRDPRDQAQHHGHDQHDVRHPLRKEPRKQRSRITDRRRRSAIWQASSYLLLNKMTQCLKQGASIESAASLTRHALPFSPQGIRKPQVPQPGGRPAPGWCFAVSATIRIIRRPVLAIRNAVTIAVSAPPAAALHVPTPITLRPCRLDVLIAAAFAYPGARYPLMVAVSPFPVPGNPHVTTARRGSSLHTRRWRCDLHNYRGSRRCGDTSEGCRYHCGKKDFPNHGYLLTIRL